MQSLLNHSPRAAGFVLILFVLSLPLPARAGVIDDVSRDFGAVTGYVVNSEGNEVIIDLDTRQHVSGGDLFSVVKPGKELIHPVTGKVIGRLEETRGLLNVTQVQEGYSMAKILNGAADIRRGDVIRRYKGIDAVFWDCEGQSEQLYKGLRSSLPHLNWCEYVSGQPDKPIEKKCAPGKRIALYFIAERGSLEVRGPDFMVVHSYPAGEVYSHVSEHAKSTEEDTNPGIVGAPPSPEKDAVVIRQSASNSKLWTGPSMKGTPVGVEVGDFDGDGKQEIAVAFSDRVEIGRSIRGDYRAIETLSLGSAGGGVALDGADLEGKGRMDLFVSAVGRDGAPASVMIGRIDGHYKIVQKGIPWLMHRVALPGEGPVLLGQNGGFSDKWLQGPVFRITSSGGRLSQGQKLNIPSGAKLYGFTPLCDASQPLFAYLAYNDHLRVTKKDGEILWEGGEQVGGSESYLEIPPAVKGLDDPAVVYLNARLDMSEAGELLVPVNRGITMISRLRRYATSELKAMVWDGGTLKESWSTVPQNGFLADFRIADGDNDGQKDLVTAFTFIQTNPFSLRKSAIQIYQLR
ncbi:MAG: hypothetical protein LLG43_04005 [Deltaproteobacteria bacterium]|nr:hypothetical protein [Deltaproteobacteria bacterium]